MRTTLLWITCMLAMPYLRAQDKVDSYGKINKTDLELKTCDFDPDAAAYCLLDIGEVSYNFNPENALIETYMRKRIKILKESGNSYANVKLRYYSKDRYEEISNISAMVYNLDDAGNVVTTKVEKSLIYDKKVDNRFSEISFAIPNVRVGSVIEYKYKDTKKSYSNIDDWYFQSDIPMRYSAYNLIIPKYFDFQYQVTRRQNMDLIKGKNDTDGEWFIMRNVASLKEEPYMTSSKDYLQRVDFQLSGINPPGALPISFRSSWQKLSDELLNEDDWFGEQIRRNIPGTSGPLKPLLANAKNDKEKVSIIYKFVQENMSWNGRYSFGSFDGVKSAWDKKSGSTGDINLILLNVLRDHGINAYPILISTRDNGKINPLLPFLEQFNAVYVIAETGEQRPYVMNAADKYNPADIYPYDVQMTTGLIVDKNNARLAAIEDESKKLKHTVNIFMKVEEDGSVNGNAVVNSYEYGKNIRRKTYDDDNLKKFFTENEGIKLAVDSMNVNNQRIDSLPLEQQVYFSGNIQQSGEYGFLPYNLFAGLGKNPFVAEERFSSIDFGFSQSYQIVGTYTIPIDYDFEELPKNMRMILPDSSIQMTRLIQKNDNILNFRVNIDFVRPMYDAEEYPDVKEVYKRLFSFLNEHVVIKKKK